MRVFRLFFAITVMLLVIGINTSAGDTVPSEENATVLTGYAHLEQFVGTWKGTASIWGDPDAEPMRNEYVVTSRMILGGNFLESQVTGVFLGMQFEGIQLVSYNSSNNTYTTQWMSNLSSDVCAAEGTLNKAGTSRSDMTTTDECPVCPEEAVAMRTVTHLIDKDHFSITQYLSGINGRDEYKNIEITYTRTE